MSLVQLNLYPSTVQRLAEYEETPESNLNGRVCCDWKKIYLAVSTVAILSGIAAAFFLQLQLIALAVAGVGLGLTLIFIRLLHIKVIRRKFL